MEIAELVDKDYTHVRNRSLRSLTTESGWGRTLPQNTTEDGICVPNFSELASYIAKGDEKVSSPYSKGYVTPSEHSRVFDMWVEDFTDKNYVSTAHLVKDNVFTTRENNFNHDLNVMRLSAQEILDMDLPSHRYMLQYKQRRTIEGYSEPEFYAAIQLTNPEHNDGMTYRPLHASTLLFGLSYTVFQACYNTDVTYGEILPYIADHDRSSKVHHHVDAFYLDWNNPGEQFTLEQQIMQNAITCLRGHVPENELVFWASTTIKGINTNLIPRLAKVATVGQVFDAVWVNNDISINTINGAALNGIDWDLLVSVR